jgi:hypothetical protein
MTKELKTAIVKFARQKFGRNDLDLRVEVTEDKRPFIVLNVDCMKMDKNSGKFDQSYFNFVTDANRKKPTGFFLDFGSSVFTPIINDFKKFMDIDLNYWFNYKNHSYIDDIETKIENAIKKSSYPKIEIGFRGSGENPKLSLTFYNVPSEFMGDYSKGDSLHEKYIQELNKLTGLDLNQYSIARTMAEKRNY